MENNETAAVEVAEVVETEAPAQVEETVVAEESAVSEASVTADKAPNKVLGGVKEWFRKRIVNIKRKPYNIPLFFLLVCAVFYLFSLNDFSKSAAVSASSIDWLGLSVFVNTLFSILVLVLFLNAFPKHAIVNKKTGKKRYINITMLVLGFAFIAVMVGLDILYMIQLPKFITGNEKNFFKTVEQSNRFSKYLSEKFLENPVDAIGDGSSYKSWLVKSYDLAITHIILLGITVVAYATLPLYKRLIMRIDTSKALDDNNIKEVIDTED